VIKFIKDVQNLYFEHLFLSKINIRAKKQPFGRKNIPLGRKKSHSGKKRDRIFAFVVKFSSEHSVIFWEGLKYGCN